MILLLLVSSVHGWSARVRSPRNEFRRVILSCPFLLCKTGPTHIFNSTHEDYASLSRLAACCQSSSMGTVKLASIQAQIQGLINALSQPAGESSLSLSILLLHSKVSSPGQFSSAHRIAAEHPSPSLSLAPFWGRQFVQDGNYRLGRPSVRASCGGAGKLVCADFFRRLTRWRI